MTRAGKMVADVQIVTGKRLSTMRNNPLDRKPAQLFGSARHESDDSRQRPALAGMAELVDADIGMTSGVAPRSQSMQVRILLPAHQPLNYQGETMSYWATKIDIDLLNNQLKKKAIGDKITVDLAIQLL